jgi:hypothetical protein
LGSYGLALFDGDAGGGSQLAAMYICHGSWKSGNLNDHYSNDSQMPVWQKQQRTQYMLKAHFFHR